MRELGYTYRDDFEIVVLEETPNHVVLDETPHHADFEITVLKETPNHAYIVLSDRTSELL